MRLLVIGTDAQGRSCLAEEVQVPAPRAAEEMAGGYACVSAERFMTTEVPPPSPPPSLAPEWLDLGVPPGAVKWQFIDFAPNADGTANHFHATDTVEMDIVVEHSFHLILGDGSAHELKVGDAALLNGSDHARRAGPHGCRMMVISIGTMPRPAGQRGE